MLTNTCPYLISKLLKNKAKKYYLDLFKCFCFVLTMCTDHNIIFVLKDKDKTVFGRLPKSWLVWLLAYLFAILLLNLNIFGSKKTIPPSPTFTTLSYRFKIWLVQIKNYWWRTWNIFTNEIVNLNMDNCVKFILIFPRYIVSTGNVYITVHLEHLYVQHSVALAKIIYVFSVSFCLVFLLALWKQINTFYLSFSKCTFGLIVCTSAGPAY